MTVTKSRVIYGDAILLVAICAFYFLTEHLTQNVMAIGLVILVLAVRSVFWHVNWYKQTGKIY